jgi:hypothetical protein
VTAVAIEFGRERETSADRAIAVWDVLANLGLMNKHAVCNIEESESLPIQY